MVCVKPLRFLFKFFSLKRILDNSLSIDKLDEMIADKRIDNLKSCKSTAVPLKEVFKKAGINVSSRI